MSYHESISFKMNNIIFLKQEVNCFKVDRTSFQDFDCANFGTKWLKIKTKLSQNFGINKLQIMSLTQNSHHQVISGYYGNDSQ